MSKAEQPVKRLFAHFRRDESPSLPDGELLGLAFEQTLMPLAILDLQTRMIRVNASLCQFFGREPHELIGMTFQDFTHPDHRGDDVEPTRQLFTGERRVHVREKRYVRSDGATMWAEVAVSLIRHGDEPSHFVIQVQDITARRAHEAELRRMADQDPLTGLRNRRGFHDRLTEHTAHVERYEPIGALLMIDLDNFKHHNDTHGHGVGDELLAAVAGRIESRLRASDVVGRYGGDEFVVLLPDSGREQAELVAGALIEQIGSTVLVTDVEIGQPIGASVGIVCFETIGAIPASAALVCADRAMYQAKNRGRNRFAVYEPEGEGELAGEAQRS